MTATFWSELVARTSGTHFFAIPGSRLFLRYEAALGFAWISETDRARPADRHCPPGRLRLEVQRNGLLQATSITLARPNDLSVVQWTPRGVVAGSSYEESEASGPGSASPPPRPARARAAPSMQEWLDSALARMVEQHAEQ